MQYNVEVQDDLRDKSIADCPQKLTGRVPILPPVGQIRWQYQKYKQYGVEEASFR